CDLGSGVLGGLVPPLPAARTERQGGRRARARRRVARGLGPVDAALFRRRVAFGGRGQRADLLAVRVEKFRDDRDGVRFRAGRIPLLRRGGRIFRWSVGRPAGRAARLDGGDARRRASAAGGFLDARDVEQCVIDG